jgi:hypothetical protein
MKFYIGELVDWLDSNGINPCGCGYISDVSDEVVVTGPPKYVRLVCAYCGITINQGLCYPIAYSDGDTGWEHPQFLRRKQHPLNPDAVEVQDREHSYA